ncbi:hypothetical protein N7450_009382 [Penicillium hetheringtonii]|uniref:Uncharacterized protein n=1 Tax=Penicillium hetheringtonii TaxID=911720 RepID=A0AAD6DAT3_9EURO|nr:hypothetical protein N7450_009382 [Penicillium hetheringtonii]
MKFISTIVAALITALPMANAWIFSTTAGQWDGEKQPPLHQGLLQRCDSKCRTQIGIASDDWNDHELSTAMGSFKVSSC